MKKSLQISALVACALISGCSKDSAGLKTDQISSDQKIRSNKNGTASFNNQLLTGHFNSLIQLGKKPNTDSVDYYAVKEFTLADQSKKLIVSAINLNISQDSAQDFYKRYNNVSELIIVAEKISISTPLKFPGSKVVIKADELSFEANGQINTTAEPSKLFPPYGTDGFKGKDGGDIVLQIKKLNLGENKVRFVLDGGKGQAAGLGKAGADGLSLTPLYGNVIKECKVTVTYCSDKEGDIENRPVTTCKGTDRVPTSGGNASSAGLPGVGGNGGKLFLPSEINIGNSASSLAGIIGEVAPQVKGGSAGTPVRALVRTINERVSRGRCGHGGGGKPGPLNASFPVDQVVSSTTDGAETSIRTITNTAKDGSIQSFSESLLDEAKALIAGNNLKDLQLEYAKDLYRNNYFTDTRVALSKVLEKESSQALNLNEELIINESRLLLNQLNSNLDYYGNGLSTAPNISFEATMEIYKRNVKTSVKTIAFVADMNVNIKSAQEKIDKLKNEKDHLRDQMEIALQNHETSYRLIPTLENKMVAIDYSRQGLEELMNKVQAQIEAEARSNIHSAEKKKKLLGGLKLIATLATVCPLGAPASQVIGASLNTIIDLSQNKSADWQDVLKDGYGVYSNLKKVDWKESHESWNRIYSSFDKDVFVHTNKIDKKRTEAYLKNLYETTKPLTSEIKKYYDETYSKKVPTSQYEAEVERIKAIHPQFKELMTKLNEVQQKKAEFEALLAQINNSLITTEAEIIKDFQMVTALDSQEEDLKDGLNFSVDDVLKKMDKNARGRLLKYKGALIKAYNYRTLMPFPGSFDLEAINRQLATFANKGGEAMTAEKLLQVYEEDTAVIGNALYDYVQNGNFKEYESEHSLELGTNELEALREGKTIFLNLGEESELFENKDNVRLISIELESFQVQAFRAKNAELKVTHMGTSILSKGSNDFIFNHSGESAVTWITRLNMANSTANLIKESSTNAGLLENIMGKDLNEGTLLFNRVGAKGVFSLKLENGQDAEIISGSLKIKYSYSIK